MYIHVLIAIVVSTGLSLIFVPLIRALFLRLGIIDKPDAVRKLQKNAVALGGGVAVFAAVSASFVAVLLLDRNLGTGELGALDRKWHLLFFAASALVVVGLLDDVFTLRGRQKLLLQALIASAVAGGGTVINDTEIFGVRITLGYLAFPLTVAWLLASINALNLIDGADGVASTAGAVISAGLALVCIATGSALGSVVAGCLCGALLGFIVFNRPPATIYLGDAGSMAIGLFVGVISIWGAVKNSTMFSVAPLLVLSLPLFDSSIAFLRRYLTGRSIFATDRAHLHHRLLNRFSHHSMLGVVALLTGISSATAYLSVVLGHQWIAFAGLVLVVGLLVLTRSFGHAELGMLVRNTANFGESLLTRSHQCDHRVHQKTVQLQGSRQWDQVWMALVEFATDRQLSSIKLDLNISWLQEGYHGSWQRSRLPEKAEQFVFKMPIVINDCAVGRLEIVGNALVSPLQETLDLLNDRFHELQEQFERLILSSESHAAADGNLLLGQDRFVSSKSGNGQHRELASEAERELVAISQSALSS